MRARLLAAFAAAVRACDPRARVAAVAPRAEVGLAIGKAALAMARGASVERGLVISPVDGDVPGWTTLVAAHPVPDETSVAAARAARAIVESARVSVLALISGGASALVEEPRIPLADFVATLRALMAAGAPIAELNAVRSALSTVKAGGLVANCRVPVTTLVASDVIGDPLAVIGSAPTIPTATVDPSSILARYDIAPISVAPRRPVVRPGDHAQIILPMRAFADALHVVLGLPIIEAPLVGEVDDVVLPFPCIAWGEPTLALPADHGVGGRAQHLALVLARRLRGTSHAALVAGTDGMDGPPPPDRPAPAGAFVDGATYEAIRAAGIDPERALARRDAGTALAAVGALVVTGSTGINHADIVVLV